MPRINSAQFFAFVAVIVGLVVSYWPPDENAAAIWLIVGSFITRAIAEIFKDPPPPPPPVPV